MSDEDDDGDDEDDDDDDEDNDDDVLTLLNRSSFSVSSMASPRSQNRLNKQEMRLDGRMLAHD